MNKYKKVILITARYWEGAFVLKEFIKAGTPCKHVFIQKSWWRKENNYEYSKLYLKKLKKESLSASGGTLFLFARLLNSPPEAGAAATKNQKVSTII